MGNPASPAAKGYNPRLYTVPRKRALLAAAEGTASPEQVSEPLIPDLEDEQESTPSRESSGATVRPQQEASGSTNPWLSTSTSTITPATRDPEAAAPTKETTSARPRPTYRPNWFGTAVDAIEYWEKQFLEADGEVRTLRKTGSFEATHAAFVTFDNINSAVSLLSAPLQVCKLARADTLLANGMPGPPLSVPLATHNPARTGAARSCMEPDRDLESRGLHPRSCGHAGDGDSASVLDSCVYRHFPRWW